MNHPAPDAVAALLELGAHLAAHPGRLPADLTPTDLTRALGHVRPTEHLVENATLATLGAARAHGLPWPHIGAALGLSNSGARDLYKRLRSRHPDYTEPLAPTLQAHRTRAWELLNALDGEVSPGTAGAAAPRLGAVLLAAALSGADDRTVRTWLADDTLTHAHQVLHAHPGDQAAQAQQVLGQHLLDGAGMRAALVALMLRALPGSEPGPAAAVAGARSTRALESAPEEDAPAPEHTDGQDPPEGAPAPEPAKLDRLLRAADLPAAAAAPLAELRSTELLLPLVYAGTGRWHNHPVGRALEAVGHAETPEALAQAVGHLLSLDGADLQELRAEPEIAHAWERLHQTVTGAASPAGPDAWPQTPNATRRPGYGPVLERAGLPPAAADALAEPLTRFVGEATLVSHREVHPQTRQVMQALQPTLLSQRPARVRTLLYLLPRLDLYGLGGWAPLALAISEHAPELERLPSSADLLGTADLPAHLAQDVDALVNGARRVLVASWAPTAPVWEAGPALERLTAAVEGGEIDHLAAALEAVAELDQTLLGQDSAFGSHQLHYQWENLAHAWRQARPAIPAAPGWSLLAAKMFPNAAMAEAVAHLLETSGPLLDTATLGEGQTHQALSTLRRAVLHGRTAGLGTVLDDVLNLKPSGHPIKDHPQVAHALTTLINAYDHQ